MEEKKLASDEVRSAWHPGPWQQEPDRIAWVDPGTGYDCLMKRHPDSLHWCGYVAVPSGHPWHGKGWDDVPAYVHGGITYCDKCDGDPVNGVCHIPTADGDDAWWIGFDCAHAGDLSPGNRWAWSIRIQSETYKDADYVRREVLSLARQAKEAA